MAEQTQDSFSCDLNDLKEAVRIHTKKITDSCRDKDCVEDLRVYFTQEAQATLNNAASVKARCAELIFANLEVEPVAFNRNHYCIDITFYYRITVDAMCGCSRPNTLYGLAVFSKRAVLCGEDGRAKIFTSQTELCRPDGPTIRSSNHPTAVVEVLDPMILSCRIKDPCECACGDALQSQIPDGICQMFEGELCLSGEHRRLYVTLGQFSLIRLERDAQLLVPTFAYRLPTKECSDSPGCAEDPCEMFSRIAFPEGKFFPSGCDGKHTDGSTDPSCCDGCCCS